ncbi:MAG: hypothetical protein OXJ53_14785 [Gammaproteobacteria bacterium]|nr:hypothetical protein [Gammaproteobacteria bacterium]MDE0269857.1 hypothetical protein [Gammaproteobacteria bacterium]
MADTTMPGNETSKNIDPEAWASLRSAISRPFPKPNSDQIALKAIDHLGDEVMKVIDVA